MKLKDNSITYASDLVPNTWFLDNNDQLNLTVRRGCNTRLVCFGPNEPYIRGCDNHTVRVRRIVAPEELQVT